MTMSISSAPAATASRVSASLISREARPLGNAVATAATWTPLSPRVWRAVAARSPYTHTAATDGQVGSAGSGRTALEARARTLPSVSAPSRVVRSTIRMARSSACAFAVVLIDRVPREAARASAPTWSTPGRPCRNRRRDASERVTSEKSPPGAEPAAAVAAGASVVGVVGIGPA